MTRTTRWRLTALMTAVLMLAGLIVRWPHAGQLAAHAEEPAKTVHVDLNVQEKIVDVLGVPTQVWTYNGTIPGPIVRLHVGDTLEITLNNTHNLPHALHTHFMDYPMSEDGSSMTAPLPIVPHQNDDAVGFAGGTVPGLAAQPGPPVGANPIGPYEPRHDEDSPRPGQSKTYTWKMLDVGAIWYHCHVMEATNHIAKGLFGMVIVYPKGWSWEELPADPGYGNTKGYAINPKGDRFREDVVIMSEINQAENSLVGLAANGGAAGGTTHLANYRAWNDPYLIGPFKPGEKGLIFVGNIGESGKSWHLHGHHWYRLWQIWHTWQGVPAWTQTNETEMTPGGKKAPPFDPNPFTPVAELAHARWVAPGEIMPTTIRAGEPGHWFGHDHVVPNAYLGMIPWLVVEDPGAEAAKPDTAGPPSVPAPPVAPEQAPHH